MGVTYDFGCNILTAGLQGSVRREKKKGRRKIRLGNEVKIDKYKVTKEGLLSGQKGLVMARVLISSRTRDVMCIFYGIAYI